MTTPTPSQPPLSTGAVPELLPCPFCGVVPVIERCEDTHDRLFGPRKWWGIKCRSTLNHGGTCAVYISPQASIEAAVKRWNTRAPLKAKQVADIDETMRLADAISYADVCCVLTAETKAYHENYRIKDAARKALRAHLAKDRT